MALVQTRTSRWLQRPRRDRCRPQDFAAYKSRLSPKRVGGLIFLLGLEAATDTLCRPETRAGASGR